MKRAFVPTALHAELTEYANLVRVLRTTRTLDLTAHLLHHAARHSDNEPDAWTLWPLIDCPVPEWSLEDEICHLGDAVVRKQTQAAREASPDSDPDSEGLSPTAANRLVFHTGAVLVHVLTLLADQRPSVPGSMQNRLSAMNWEDVTSLLAVSGVLDPSIIARAQKRLERIYGPSTAKAMQRAASATSAKARCASWAAVGDEQLFAPPVLSRTHRRNAKGKRSRSHKSGVIPRTVVDTDTNTDAEQTHLQRSPTLTAS